MGSRETPHMSAHTDAGMSRMSLVAKDVLPWRFSRGRSLSFPRPAPVGGREGRYRGENASK